MVLNNINKNDSILLEVLASVFTVSSNFTDNPRIFSMRKVKASLNSVQVQHLYESYVLLDSLLKHHLTRGNTFSLIRSCGNDVYNVEKSKEDT